jgi:RNA polymerase sigma-70 factor (ECF subfamily)
MTSAGSRRHEKSKEKCGTVLASMPFSSDQDAARAWCGGDDGAGEYLIRRHYDGVVRFFATKMRGDTSDLVQATFLRAAEARPRLRDTGSFRAFLYGIARNLLYETIRERQRREKHFEFDAAVTSAIDLNGGPSTLARVRQEQQTILNAVQSLPMELQVLLELTYWQELRGPELSDVLGVPLGTVKSRLNRARRLLRDQLERQAGREGMSEPLRRLSTEWITAGSG